MPSQPTPIPPDDLSRELTVARPDHDQSLPHIGLVGDTYTILVTGEDTAGKYTLIDMHVPPGGGPPPHRHDFEEMFTVLDGEIRVTFRGETLIARPGETINVPANAPHAFTNAGNTPSRPSTQVRRISSVAPLPVGAPLAISTLGAAERSSRAPPTPSITQRKPVPSNWTRKHVSTASPMFTGRVHDLPPSKDLIMM